jgi:hypothetical protein
MVKLTIMSIETVDPRIKKYKKIITVNPYIDEAYQYKDKTLKVVEKLEFNKNFVISYVTNRDMIIASFDLGYDVDIEELDDLIYMKAYDELGLDTEKEYSIHHQKAESNEDSNVYNLFITEPEVIDKNLQSTLEATKYIDLLLPAPLLFQTLYSNHTLESSEAHCFIYFTMQDSFVTIYKDGKFLYSKSLEYSLEQIYEKYCALIGEKIDKKEFFETLESEGLKATNSSYQQNLMKLFSEIFLQINDIIIYTKRAYNIETIGKLFLGSVKSPIIGLGDYGYNYLGIPTFNLDFKFDMKNDEWYVDQFQYMMVQSGLDYLQTPAKIVNLSTTPRAPVFSKRASGQFIIATLFSSLAALSWPLSYLLISYTNDATNIILTSKDNDLKKIDDKYKKILGEKQKEIQAKKKEFGRLTMLFDGKAKTLTAIYNKKVDYHLKSQFLFDFATDLTGHEVNVEKISSYEDKYTLNLVSYDEKKLTKYIKFISKKYFDEINKIDIHRIEMNSIDTKYRGILEVGYR